jgi:hypothetical protein
MYSKVGGFWSSLLRCFHVSGKWPTLLDIFTSDTEQVQIEMSPMARFGADIIWKQGQHRLTYKELADTRILPGTRLELLLRRFRRDASSQSSRDTSAPREREREIERISSDDDEEVLEEIRRNHLQIEASDEEIDEETDTEHENAPREEAFANKEDINPAITERMNNLTQILGAERQKDENEEEEQESQRLEQLEELLKSFEQNEISIEECT